MTVIEKSPSFCGAFSKVHGSNSRKRQRKQQRAWKKWEKSFFVNTCVLIYREIYSRGKFN